MKLCVALTVHNRPEYLAQVLRTWEVARGVGGVDFHLQVEPNSPSMGVIEDYYKLWRSCQLNEDQKGPLWNPWFAIDSAFQRGADFVILGEDDSIVSADILEYFKFAAEVFHKVDDVFVVCSFQDKPQGRLDEVIYRDYFASVVWGIWKETWYDEVRGSWDPGYQPAWDQGFINRLEGRHCVFPAISRSQHIGEHGSHMTPVRFHELQAEQFITYCEPQSFQVKEGVFQ